MILWIVLWVLWLAGVYGSYSVFLYKKFPNRVVSTPIHYGLATILTAIVGWKFMVPYLQMNWSVVIASLVALYVALLGSFAFCRKYLPIAKTYREKFDDQPHLSIENKYIFYKTFDILFQDTMIILIVSYLFSLSWQLFSIQLLLAGIFGATHLLHVVRKPNKYVVIHTIFAILASLLFPYIIYTNNYAFLWLIVIHSAYYVLMLLYGGLYVKYRLHN